MRRWQEPRCVRGSVVQYTVEYCGLKPLLTVLHCLWFCCSLSWTSSLGWSHLCLEEGEEQEKGVEEESMTVRTSPSARPLKVRSRCRTQCLSWRWWPEQVNPPPPPPPLFPPNPCPRPPPPGQKHLNHLIFFSLVRFYFSRNLNKNSNNNLHNITVWSDDQYYCCLVKQSDANPNTKL